MPDSEKSTSIKPGIDCASEIDMPLFHDARRDVCL